MEGLILFFNFKFTSLLLYCTGYLNWVEFKLYRDEFKSVKVPLHQRLYTAYRIEVCKFDTKQPLHQRLCTAYRIEVCNSTYRVRSKSISGLFVIQSEQLPNQVPGFRAVQERLGPISVFFVFSREVQIYQGRCNTL